MVGAKAGGERPVWNADEERWGVFEESGLVLVLMPPGRFVMGSHPVDGPNVDPMNQQNELPQHEVALDAFFLSKYELTQAQYARAADGRRPSAYQPGHPNGVEDETHPVERLNWTESERALFRLDLVLPTEAQWEYACRAGTSGVWSWGDDPGVAGEHANFKGEAVIHRHRNAKTIGSSEIHAQRTKVGIIENVRM